MEKRLNNKISAYIHTLKEDIKNAVKSLDIDEEKLYPVVQFIYDYQHLVICKNDLQKRKRVKNIVPFCYRCKAKRANNEQCSRRKKDGAEFCGTHIKGIPHGKINVDEIEETNNRKKVTVWAEEIMGITYYLDNNKNVYSPSDILNEIENPRVIAKWEKRGDEYTIPALFKK